MGIDIFGIALSISIVDISTLLKNIDIDIDIDKAILKNIDIDIDIDKAIPKISISISISIWWFWKISISISISIRQFCKISISLKYRIDSNLAYRTGLTTQIMNVCIDDRKLSIKGWNRK